LHMSAVCRFIIEIFLFAKSGDLVALASTKDTQPMIYHQTARPILLALATLVFAVPVHALTKPVSTVHLYSEHEIFHLIALPVTTAQLLENLWKAWDLGWLVQPSFYSNANLLKFFNAAEVKWDHKSRAGDAPGVDNATVTVNAQAFPNMRVKMIRGVLRKAEDGKAAALSGVIIIDVASVPGLNVGLVRRIFGEESKDELDFGILTDGQAHDPTTAGSLVYDNRDSLKMSGVSFQEYRATFVVKKIKPGMPIQGSRLADDAQIETIDLLQMER
jgi:hypothetical protein